MTEPYDPEAELAQDRREFAVELPKMVYVSGALSDMSEEERRRLRAFYRDIGRVCKEFGYEVYLPHIYGDPKLVANKTPEEIDEIDRLAVTLSYIVIAYVGVASLGVGIEIEMANHACKPVVLLYEQERLDARRISRLVRGNGAVVNEIVFTDFDDAIAQLHGVIAGITSFRQELPLPLRAP